MAGVPCMRGTRIPVATVVGMVAEGMTVGEILADFPQLIEADVREPCGSRRLSWTRAWCRFRHRREGSWSMSPCNSESQTG
ncbi:MAG: DUF433 domain-containing protein [Egibacteraceae bacterium]